MTFEYLVRNYYKRNGSFNGIMATYLKSSIQNLAQQNGVTEDALLYSALGCHSICVRAHGLTAHFSPLEFFSLQQAYYRGDVATVNRMFRKVEVQLGSDDCKKLFAVFGQKNMKYFGKLAQCGKESPCEFPLYVQMLYDYCLKSTDRYSFAVPDENESVTISFSEYLNYAFMKETDITKKAISQMQVLPRIESCPAVQNPVIAGRVLYVPETLAKKQVKDVYSEVYKRLERYISLRKLAGHVSVGQLAFLDHVDDEGYMRIQILASALGISYDEFISGFGMRVPDELRIFRSAGLLAYKLGEQIVCSFQDAAKNQYIHCSNPIPAADFDSVVPLLSVDARIIVSEDTIRAAAAAVTDGPCCYCLEEILQCQEMICGKEH